MTDAKRLVGMAAVDFGDCQHGKLRNCQAQLLFRVSARGDLEIIE
jgi:hypothetical protein